MQLLVSFGAAGSWSFAALKLIFSLSVGFALTEKITFFANQKFSIQKAYEPPSKTSRFRKPNTACSNNFLLSSKTAFSRTKTFLLHKPFLADFKNRPFSQIKSLSFAQIYPFYYPKKSFSTLRLPFAPPLTYCPQRMQLFFCCSL